ncbi:MAG: hypothetical protein HYU33_03405 [Candidatus Omnitrophica bacterium]|nr:hypothetical protein [Candidatus Omnitrophota bacterium]
MTVETPQIFEEVELGKDPKIDPGVTIGYRPGRTIGSLLTKLGDGCVVRGGTIIYAGTHIGNHLETGHYVVIREENKIGEHFSIWNHSTVDYGCVIGNKVKVHNRVCQ